MDPIILLEKPPSQIEVIGGEEIRKDIVVSEITPDLGEVLVEPTKDQQVANKKYVDRFTGNHGSAAMLEDGVTGDSVALIPDEQYNSVDSHDESNFNSFYSTIGHSAGNEYTGFSFKITTSNYLYGVELYLDKEGSPADNTIVQLMDQGGNIIDSETVASSLISASVGFYRFNFAKKPYILQDTTYYIIVRRSGANDATNYIRLGEDRTTVVPAHSADYANGQLLQGSSFATLAVFGTSPYSDAIFKLYEADTSIDAVLALTRADSQLLTFNHVGFLDADYGSGDTATYTQWPSIEDLSGIDAGLPLYISETPGEITSVKPTGTGIYPNQIAIGESTTSLIRVPNRHYFRNGNELFHQDTDQIVFSQSLSGGGVQRVTFDSIFIPAGTVDENGHVKIMIEQSNFSASSGHVVDMEINGVVAVSWATSAGEEYIELELFFKNSLTSQRQHEFRDNAAPTVSDETYDFSEDMFITFVAHYDGGGSSTVAFTRELISILVFNP